MHQYIQLLQVNQCYNFRVLIQLNFMNLNFLRLNSSFGSTTQITIMEDHEWEGHWIEAAKTKVLKYLL